jgi:alcohol dehydrogenase class IV
VGFSAPTRLISAAGALGELPAVLDTVAHARLAVVADRGLASATSLLDRLRGLLEGREYLLLELVSPDPTTADAEAAAAVALDGGCDAVVALGGGSALALGKAVGVLLRNPPPILGYAGRDRAPRPPAPCVAIPTTAGSGSEVSNALVLHDPSLESIVVVRGSGYEPAAAILDGELLTDLPAQPLLDAALDALSHGFEALWARGRSRFTDALAFAAIDEIHTLLPRALAQRDVDDLQGLLEASAMANLACGPSGLGLVHALSSATAVHVPHGRQNGVLLPHVATFNRDHVPVRVRDEIDRLPALYEAIGAPPTFAAGEIDAAGAAAIVRVAIASPLHHNNVRHASAEELVELLGRAGAPPTSLLLPREPIDA